MTKSTASDHVASQVAGSRDQDQQQGSKRALLYLRVSTARQASKGTEAEGYSIPAQREACSRKARELGASVVDEYVDAGASARSADRPALQALLERLMTERDADYVIVHKVDRLARDRHDDVTIGLAIHQAGALLVSATEQIDDTPAGSLLHGIMAAIAEFYSKNLSSEAKKGIREMVKRGGTHGYAPLGYHNSTARIDGKEVKTVVLDRERAPHIRWLFETYASGNWSISELTAELARRGLKSRPSASFAGSPLTRSQVHRILCNRYYRGEVVHCGVAYPGKHQPLIAPEIWDRVQELLVSRRHAGDRASKHGHYLKGSIFCGGCRSRLGVSYSTGRGGTYAYFYCLGRNKKRTSCALPFLTMDKTAADLDRYWRAVQFAPDLVAAIRRAVTDELVELRAADAALLDTQRRRLRRLERQRQKLIDAYLAEAIPVADLKARQDALAVEQADAERLIAGASASHQLAEKHLGIALDLLAHGGRLYAELDEAGRQHLNQALFAEIYVDQTGVTEVILNQPFRWLAERGMVIALADGEPEPEGKEQLVSAAADPEEPPQLPAANCTGPELLLHRSNRSSCTRPNATFERSSNLSILAETMGLEPTTPCLQSRTGSVRPVSDRVAWSAAVSPAVGTKVLVSRGSSVRSVSLSDCWR
ncbi:MAG TPA: recombinase family protein [Acidimicrobiales bacterium]|nr:recombinase family protein [Acidimicrobiales bacterium]